MKESKEIKDLREQVRLLKEDRMGNWLLLVLVGVVTVVIALDACVGLPRINKKLNSIIQKIEFLESKEKNKVEMFKTERDVYRRIIAETLKNGRKRRRR